jgi:chemotaxis protein MotB
MAKNARKKKKEQGSGGGGSFIVLFTALSTILLALFIMMNAQASRDEYKVKEVWGSIKANFAILDGGVGFTPGKDFMPPGAPIRMGSPEDWSNSILFTEMHGFFREQGGGKGVATYFDGEELVISLPSGVLFQAGTQNFRPEVGPILKMVAHVIRRTKNAVEIGGHADDARPPTTNWDLSVSRALAVASWVIDQGRVQPKRFRVAAFAKNRPIPPKGSVALSDANRRVSIRFLAKEDARLVPYSGSLSFRGFFFRVRSLAEGN